MHDHEKSTQIHCCVVNATTTRINTSRSSIPNVDYVNLHEWMHIMHAPLSNTTDAILSSFLENVFLWNHLRHTKKLLFCSWSFLRFHTLPHYYRRYVLEMVLKNECLFWLHAYNDAPSISLSFLQHNDNLTEPVWQESSSILSWRQIRNMK